MLAYIVRRIVATIPVMAIVALFVFSLLYIAPGDPAAVIAGDQASPEDVERIRAGLGLDRPFLVRFGEWFWQHPARRSRHLDLHQPAGRRRMIAQRLEPTLSLMIVTLLLSVTIAVPMGVIAAWKAGTWIDRGLMAFAVLGFSVPVFVVGYRPGLCLRAGARMVSRAGLHAAVARAWALAENLVLPAIALGCVYIALIARITRASMLEVLQQDYIRTARAKGMGSAASCSCMR